MEKLKRPLRIFLSLACALLPTALFSYSSGPDAGLSGVPGEANCTACHSGSKGSGSVKVTFPGALTYKPGVAQQLVVTVTDSAQRRWGFQLTARQSAGTTKQAGAFTVGSDGYTQLVCTSSAFSFEEFGKICTGSTSYPLQYIEHTSAGTRYGQTGSAQFTFTWTPPATSVGNVTVYVAGNAANGDGGTGGDHIYTASYTLSPAATNVPTISTNGVFNAAGFQPSIAAGSWVGISGTNLSSTTRQWAAADFSSTGAFPTSLDGVSVTIDGLPAFVEYVSPTQVNVQAPTDASTGPVAVVVTNSLGTSQAATVTLQSASPAFFLWSGQYAAATRPDYTFVGSPTLFGGGVATPAKPGDTVILWGTGFGATSPAVPAGQNTPSTTLASLPPGAVTVTIGNISTQVLGAALTPGNGGVYQIAIRVPDNAPDGDLPVVVSVAGVQSPAGVFLTVKE